MSIEIVLKDRIKEISHSTGTGNFQLDGASTGYSQFSGIVPYDSTVFYCIRDNENYEVGSGVFFLNGSSDNLSRFPYQSTNNDNVVNFGAGVKEVFVTYPGKYSVVSALPNDTQPAKSGIPFWNNAHTLNYNGDFIFEDANARVGIRQPSPQYAIDIGGNNAESTIKASGMIIGDSGILFSGITGMGGRQTEPFLKNLADAVTGFSSVITMSGDVNETLQFEKQLPTTFFCGPSGGCGCTEDYPTFRVMDSGDIPDLSFHYTKQFNPSDAGAIAVYKASGVHQFDTYLKWDVTNNRLGVNKVTPVYTLDVDGTVGVSGGAIFGSDVSVIGDVTVSGNLDVQGAVTYIDSTNVTILDKQLELGSISGAAQYDEASLNDAGLVVKSTTATSGDKYMVWKGSNDSWNIGQGLSVSGAVVSSGNWHNAGTIITDGAFTTAESATVSGALNVSGVTTLNSTLAVTANSTFSGLTTIDDDLYITGNTVASGTVGISGVANFGNIVTVSGILKFGTSNINIGTDAGSNTILSTTCNFVGASAGTNANNSSNLNVFGSNAGRNVSGCDLAVMLGYLSGDTAQGASSSFFGGVSAGRDSTNMSSSVIVGCFAGLYASGTQNTSVGCNAGYSASGTRNVYIGGNAGYNVAGSRNIEILASGASSSVFITSGVPNTNDKLNINSTIVGDMSTKRLAIGGVTETHLSPNSTLQVIPNSTSTVGISINLDAEHTASLFATSGTTYVNTIVDNSGFLVIPTYATVAAATGAIPVAQNGAMALADNSAILISNGTVWLSGSLSVIT